MERLDVVQLVREGKARYGWHWITSSVDELRLRIAVLRDGMKFDDVPPLNYRREIQSGANWRDGVRLPASAHELQQIADMIGAMLLTPRVVDLIWLSAKLKFDAIVNSGEPDYRIVATMDIFEYHDFLEEAIARLGGDDGSQLVSCVGKYWCLVNELFEKGMARGDWAACNYGWCAKAAPWPGVTDGSHVWQTRGYTHNKRHLDPSQVIRMMYEWGELSRDGGDSWEQVHLIEVARDATLAALLTHDGQPLDYLRQRGVKPEQRVGHVVLPPVTIKGGSDPGVPAGSVS